MPQYIHVYIYNTLAHLKKNKIIQIIGHIYIHVLELSNDEKRKEKPKKK